MLAYATVPRIAAVMLFSQEMSVRAEEDMARMTRALIDRVTEIGGSYYLPYRPHPTLDQCVAPMRVLASLPRPSAALIRNCASRTVSGPITFQRSEEGKPMPTVRKIAFAYAAILLVVAGLNYIPA